MSRTAKLILFVLLTLFSLSGARAQLAVNPTPPVTPICIDKSDAYKLALADMQGTLPATWEGFLKEGRCGFLPARYLFTIDNYKDNTDVPSRVVEMSFRGELVWGIRAGLPTSGVWMIRDNGQWNTDEERLEIAKWFRTLMQPDNKNVSCCGEADAYYADKIVVRNGKNYAVITDDRDDAQLQRPHVPIGTEILIPDHKYKRDEGNPTGHRVIFIGRGDEYDDYTVYCYVGGTEI